MNKKAVLITIMGLSLAGTGAAIILLIKRKDSPKVQSIGEVGQVVSDKLPKQNVVSQKIVNEAIVTRTTGGNTVVERENRKPVVISNPRKSIKAPFMPRNRVIAMHEMMNKTIRRAIF